AVAQTAAEVTAQRDRAVVIDAVDRILEACGVAEIARLVDAVGLALAGRDACLEFLDRGFGRQDVERLDRMGDPPAGRCRFAGRHRFCGRRRFTDGWCSRSRWTRSGRLRAAGRG